MILGTIVAFLLPQKFDLLSFLTESDSVFSLSPYAFRHLDARRDLLRFAVQLTTESYFQVMRHSEPWPGELIRPNS